MPECAALLYTLPVQGVGEALRRGWRARSGESSFVLQTQSRRDESEREAEAMEQAEKEAITRELERAKAVAFTTYSFDRTRTTRLRVEATSAPSIHLLCHTTTACISIPLHECQQFSKPNTAHNSI